MKRFELYDFIMKTCDELDAFPEIDAEDVSSWEAAAREALFESYRHAPDKDTMERIRQAKIAIHKACEDFIKSQPRPVNGLEALEALRRNIGREECYAIVEKELKLFRSLLKVAFPDDSDKEFIEKATEEDIREAYRNDELPKKEELSADDWVKLFAIAKEAIGAETQTTEEGLS